jgi:hypothetical protein
MIYRLLDIFFLIFHTFLIFFNLFGWIWNRTRKLNLITLSLTGASWLFLGLIVGTLGYCPLTDWRFKVLEKLGHTDLPYSYTKYLTERLTGLDINASLIDEITLWSFIAALVISLFFNVIRYGYRIKKRPEIRIYLLSEGMYHGTEINQLKVL